MFSNICGLALLAAILPGPGSAGAVSQRASNLICGKKGYDRGNGNTCKSGPFSKSHVHRDECLDTRLT